jgi:hypothetical protein
MNALSETRSPQRNLEKRKKVFILQYKVDHGCAECETSHPAILDLHHREASEKNPKLRRGNRGGGSWTQLSWLEITAELEKCDVLCSNCHRLREWRTGSDPMVEELLSLERAVA